MLDAEMVLRRELWLGHGHIGLYGDDGEMQCAECMVDYKRADACTVRAAFARAFGARLAETEAQAAAMRAFLDEHACSCSDVEVADGHHESCRVRPVVAPDAGKALLAEVAKLRACAKAARAYVDNEGRAVPGESIAAYQERCRLLFHRLASATPAPEAGQEATDA